MNAARARPRVAYLLRSYPRLSQTFILNEILALEQLGLDLQLFALTNSREPIQQPQVAHVRAPIHYLDDAQAWPQLRQAHAHLTALRAAPRRYWAAWWYLTHRADLEAGYTAGSRFACFQQAVQLVDWFERERQRTGRPVEHLHAHFAHDPTLVALLVHKLTGLPFSFTAHARDLYQVAAPALSERVAAARAVVTCCRSNLDYFQQALPAPLAAKVRLIYHGVNLQGFQPAAQGASPNEAPLILSVGRLVEKKGFPDLLHACARLREAGQRFQLRIYGEGPLRAELSRLITHLGLEAAVDLPGACAQPELVPAFQRAAVFALTPFVTDDGDRDGVPNVLVEAMACGLPVVSTRVAGIPELVQSEHNGLLAEPHDVAALAAALAALLADEPKRRRLGAAARQTVVEHFDLRRGAAQLAALFAGGAGPLPMGVTAV